MFRMYLIFCTLLVHTLVASPSISEEKAPPPKETLNGQWQADMSDSQALLLRIDDEVIEMKINVGGQQSLVWVGKLALSKEHPDQHMDWTNLKSGGRAFPDNRCLFKLEGNTLLVIGGGPTDRPTRFYSGPGSEPKTLIFKRVEPVRGNAD